MDGATLPPHPEADAPPAQGGPRGAEPVGRAAPPACALVLSGGVALGAFEAGAFAALAEAGGLVPDWLVGTSIGAVNAAIIAGNPPERRVERLRGFWDAMAGDPFPLASFWFGPPPASGAWRDVHNQAAAWQSLLLGRPGLFQSRLAPGALAGKVPSLFDLQPLRARLPEWLDFDRLNGAGAPRLTILATELGTGERVVFDTARGDRIGPDHLLASCALLPLFSPVEVEGRLLADGGFAANTALDLVLDAPLSGDLTCFAVELFARHGSVPRTLPAALARAGDLAFGNQTQRLLEGRGQAQRWRALFGRLAAQLPPELRNRPEVAAILAEAGDAKRSATLLLLGYRAAMDEAGPGKFFDFSRATLADRWVAGSRGMRDALQRLTSPAGGTALAPGLLLHEVEA
ncbi:patatin-like phospholipase family protein [Roseomonas sp. BN140053]|uniref:patatin-like phospholipase family protein n=1 Tax=Roseomonas sp. BN140053 TaxID=3391898 RepID=UPI0039EA2F20